MKSTFIALACFALLGAVTAANFLGHSRPNMAKALKQYHQQAFKNAEVDAKSQTKNEKIAMIRSKLYKQAQSYAEVAHKEEGLANAAAKAMQLSSSRAQIFNSKIKQLFTGARKIALNTLGSMSGDSSYSSSYGSNVRVSSSKSGSRTFSAAGVSQTYPMYKMHVSGSSTEDDYLEDAKRQLRSASSSSTFTQTKTTTPKK